jgi:hypothetical protein
MSGSLDLQARALLQASCHPLTGLGDWFWRWRISEPTLPRVCLALFLSCLLAGRGGEGRREGSSGKVVFPFFERFLLPCAARMFALLTAGVLLRRPPFYACLLPPVAGAGVSMASLFPPLAMVQWYPLFLLPGITGVGSPLS